MTSLLIHNYKYYNLFIKIINIDCNICIFLNPLLNSKKLSKIR